MASAVTANGDGFLIRVRLTPKSSKDALEGEGADADGAPFLKARVRAVPEKGKANAALEALLAKQLGVPKTSVSVEKGASDRVKTVRVAANGDALARARALLRGTA